MGPVPFNAAIFTADDFASAFVTSRPGANRQKDKQKIKESSSKQRFPGPNDMEVKGLCEKHSNQKALGSASPSLRCSERQRLYGPHHKSRHEMNHVKMKEAEK